jgi:F-type H+-transporting ATPase subunit b
VIPYQILLAVEDVGEAEETVNPILPVGNELVWGAICFFGLYALMKFVLLPPVLRVMDERDRRLRADREAVDAAETGAADAQAAYDARIAEARAEANAIISAAREEADAYRAERFGEANAELAELRAAASAEVAAAKAAALAQLRGGVATVAVDAASRVIGRDLDLQRELAAIEDYVNTSSDGASSGEART